MSIVVSQKGWLIRLIEIQLKLKKWNWFYLIKRTSCILDKRETFARGKIVRDINLKRLLNHLKEVSVCQWSDG